MVIRGCVKAFMNGRVEDQPFSVIFHQINCVFKYILSKKYNIQLYDSNCLQNKSVANFNYCMQF